MKSPDTMCKPAVKDPAKGSIMLTAAYVARPQHVLEATLRHIAQSYGWSCEIPVKDVALMQKPLNR